jgi:hypothetical protein
VCESGFSPSWYHHHHGSPRSYSPRKWTLGLLVTAVLRRKPHPIDMINHNQLTFVCDCTRHRRIHGEIPFISCQRIQKVHSWLRDEGTLWNAETDYSRHEESVLSQLNPYDIDVLTEVKKTTTLFFSVVTPCSLVGRYQRFGRSCVSNFTRPVIYTRVLHGMTTEKNNNAISIQYTVGCEETRGLTSSYGVE